jgi:hypothetical protein
MPTQWRTRPALALDAQGRPLSLWIAQVAGKHSRLMSSRRATPAGVASKFEEPVELSTNVADTYSQQPPTLVFDGKDFVAAWTGGANDSTVYTARYDTATEQWGPEAPVSDEAVSTQILPRLVTDRHRSLTLLFARATTDYDGQGDVSAQVVYQRYNAATGAWGPVSEFPGGFDRIDATNYDRMMPLLGSNAEGVMGAAWVPVELKTDGDESYWAPRGIAFATFD